MTRRDRIDLWSTILTIVGYVLFESLRATAAPVSVVVVVFALWVSCAGVSIYYGWARIIDEWPRWREEWRRLRGD